VTLAGISGQFRVVEALISAVIIVVAFTAALELQQIPRSWSSRMKTDLEALAFNVLLNLAESNVPENIGSPRWEHGLFIVLQTLLPPATYFNLTVYRITVLTNGTVLMEPLNKAPISNMQSQDLSEALEAASAAYVYTTRKGEILLLVLTLSGGWR